MRTMMFTDEFKRIALQAHTRDDVEHAFCPASILCDACANRDICGLTCPARDALCTACPFDGYDCIGTLYRVVALAKVEAREARKGAR